MYEKILLDEEYTEMMEKIASFHFSENGKWDWEHGIGHALRVSRYVQKIMGSLNQDKRSIELGMIAALLHDIGLITGVKKNHAERSAYYAKEYLKKYPLKEKEKKWIVEAIADHSNGRNMKNPIAAALVLADKLDVNKKRVEHSTIQDEINSEVAKINRVDVEINENDICIFFKTKKDFNPSILRNWDKCLLLPPVVSAYFHRKCIFKINHQNLDVESVVAK